MFTVDVKQQCNNATFMFKSMVSIFEKFAHWLSTDLVLMVVYTKLKLSLNITIVVVVVVLLFYIHSKHL